MRVAIVLAAGASRRFGRANKLLMPIDREVLVYLGDMPFVPCPGRWRLGGHDAVRPAKGHPVLLRAAALPGLRIAGDHGLAPLLAGLRLRTVPAGAGARIDVDTRAAWRRARIAAGHPRVRRRCR